MVTMIFPPNYPDQSSLEILKCTCCIEIECVFGHIVGEVRVSLENAHMRIFRGKTRFTLTLKTLETLKK